ncbi:MAG: hypothetical protein IPL83_11120 [Bdellovibrionales bacterium]|nr:hypothetical protein [Bdellovibrionales bacterium]
MKTVLYYIVAVFGSFYGTYYFGMQVANQSEDRHPMLLPPENIEHFTFGYGDSIADSLWIRSIQDMEFCGATAVTAQVSQFDEPKSSVQTDPTGTPKSPAQCKKGWAFHMLNEITDLSPKFEIVYTMGATGLSILVDDREGAEIIFDKGVVAFPRVWQISYTAAYHALFETGNLEKGARLLKQAGDSGAPGWVYFLATHVYSQAGLAELGKAVVEEYIQKFPPDEVPLRAKQRLAEVEAILRKERGISSLTPSDSADLKK